MPCRDYESDSWGSGSADRAKLKAQADKMARIACKAMTALEENGIEDFLVLKDEEVREWWAQHKEADRREQARIAEKERRERVKAEALAKLSSEERELLGLAPKVKSSKVKTARAGRVVPMDEVIEEIAYDLDDLLKQVNGGDWK